MFNKQFMLWLAGFIDGEGCFFIRRTTRRKTDDYWLTITQGGKNGESILRNIQNELNMGRVRSRKGKTPHIWTLYIQKKSDLNKILPELIPLLRIKGENAKSFYDRFKEQYNP
jgi:hypothetical protein